MEIKEKEGRKRQKKKKKLKEFVVRRRGEKRKEEKEKKNFGVFGSMIFWYNFLIFAEVIISN